MPDEAYSTLYQYLVDHDVLKALGVAMESYLL